MSVIQRRLFVQAATVALLTPWAFVGRPAWAADEAPDVMIKRLSNEVLSLIHGDADLQKGNIRRVIEVVDQKIMPNVNFIRMTASAVGPAWRQASAGQRQKLEQEFKTLLIHTYAGALRHVGDQRIDVLPMRGDKNADQVVVRSRVLGNADPVQLDYRMERTPGDGTGWKVYDLNVAGVWMGANYRSQFASEINRNGIDGLIKALHERNQTNQST